MGYLIEILDFRWANGLSIGVARAFFLAFFAAIVVFGWSFGREYVYRGAEDQARWRDLRLWVIGIMAIPAVIYLVF